jgi:hypothetical protein
MPVNVAAPEHVVIDAPSAGGRGVGVVAIIVGGILFSGAGTYAYIIVANCGEHGVYEGTPQCRQDMENLPGWLAAAGIGAVVGGVGILVYASNNKPSVDVLPALGSQARREPGTFVGLGPVEGSTLPGLSLRTSF